MQLASPDHVGGFSLVREASPLSTSGLFLFFRMKNPHLRAKLAEVLEAVMPHLDQAQNPLVSSVFHRKRVFCSYYHAAHLAEALIKVFVDIEFTGKQGRGRRLLLTQRSICKMSPGFRRCFGLKTVVNT